MSLLSIYFGKIKLINNENLPSLVSSCRSFLKCCCSFLIISSTSFGKRNGDHKHSFVLEVGSCRRINHLDSEVLVEYGQHVFHGLVAIVAETYS